MKTKSIFLMCYVFGVYSYICGPCFNWVVFKHSFCSDWVRNLGFIQMFSLKSFILFSTMADFRKYFDVHCCFTLGSGIDLIWMLAEGFGNDRIRLYEVVLCYYGIVNSLLMCCCFCVCLLLFSSTYYKYIMLRRHRGVNLCSIRLCTMVCCLFRVPEHKPWS